MAGLYEPIRRPGEPPPVVVAGALGDIASALYALIGMLAALRQRERTGRGQHVDIAMFDAMVAMTDMVPFMWSIGEPPSAATAGRTGLVTAFAASDGYFVIAIFRDHQFERLAHLVGQPDWCSDPRFATREGWAAHRESVVRPAVEAWARDKTKLEASRLVAAQGIPAGPSNLAPDLFADPHVAARDMLIEVPRADGGAADARGRQPGEALRARPRARSRRCPGSASTPRRCCARRSRSTTASSRRCGAKE